MTTFAVATADLHLGGPAPVLRYLDLPARAGAVLALVRVHGRPVGRVRVPLEAGLDPVPALLQAVRDELSDELVSAVVLLALEAEQPTDPLLLGPVGSQPAPPAADLPTLTVAVCTRDRPADLARCLAALARQVPAPLEVLVVDNAPKDDAVRREAQRYPFVRYLREPRPGLDWARSLALEQARGELLAFTDDDCEPDPSWSGAVCAAFAADPAVGCVTGLVEPAALGSTSARLFEEDFGGFAKGYRQRWWHAPLHTRAIARSLGGAGQYGTGANMAFRSRALRAMGPFDPALDVGTVTNGGGDLEMLFRTLKAGHAIAYEPWALVRHHHRSERGALLRQLSGWGTGSGAYLASLGRRWPEERRSLAVLWLWWLGFVLRPAAGSLVHDSPRREPAVAQVVGLLRGPARYRQAQQSARLLEPRVTWPVEAAEPLTRRQQRLRRQLRGRTAVRRVEIGRPLPDLTGLAGEEVVRVYVGAGRTVVGFVELPCHGCDVPAERLRRAVAAELGTSLVADWPGRTAPGGWRHDLVLGWTGQQERLEQMRLATGPEPVPGEPVAVSVVVATRGRPELLQTCLTALRAHVTRHHVEIVVVDNDPADPRARQVVDRFPGVVYVAEPVPGLSPARNAGVRAAGSPIVVTTDDDVEVGAGWLDRLVEPFSRPDVGVVTGNVLPALLGTWAQREFERYGGLGRGFAPRTFSPTWMQRARTVAATWEIGATANAAFRRDALLDPSVGGFPLALGAGATGVGEDTYAFYRMLKAGWTCVYQPGAVVWHTHRETRGALARQLTAYSRGHVTYHLHTLVEDGDLRGLYRLLYEVPRHYLGRVRRRERFTMLPVEVLGTLQGPVSYLRHRRRAAAIAARADGGSSGQGSPGPGRPGTPA